MKFRSRIFFIALLHLFIATLLSAQNNKPVRVELEAVPNSRPYQLLACGQEGAMVIYESKHLKGTNDRNWVLRFYDQNLKERWLQPIPVNRDLELNGMIHYQRVAYLAFLNDDKDPELENLLVYRVDLSDGSYDSVAAKVPGRSGLGKIAAYNDWVYLGLDVPKSSPVVLTINFKHRQVSQAAMEGEKDAVIMDLSVDMVSRELVCVLADYPHEQQQIHLVFMGLEGKIVRQQPMQKNHLDKSLNTCEYRTLADGKAYAVGAYRLQDQQKQRRNTANGFASTGFYISRISALGQEYIKYYKFADFEQFYNAMSSEDIITNRRKLKKLEKAGKELMINYQLLVHDIQPRNNQLVVVAEAYYPQYRTVSTMTYDIYGRLMPTYYNVFEGYRYTNAFVASFNNQGDKLWDNSFELREMLTEGLERRVNTFLLDEEVVLAYSYGGRIASKIIRGAEVVEGVAYDQIQSFHPKDQINDDYGSAMQHWYGNYFLCSGYQRINNGFVASRNKQTVFYLNKIGFR